MKMVILEEKNTAKERKLSNAEKKEIGSFYVEKYKFIEELLQVFPRPSSKENGTSEESNSYALHELPSRLCPALKKNMKPAKTPEELIERLSKLRGKPKLSYKDKLFKKNLKNRLLKKTKKERRKQNTCKKLKIEKEEKPKQEEKPALSSNGEVIYSKIDFSVSGINKQDKKKFKKDPNIVLKNLKEQEKKLKTLKEEGNLDQVKEIVERKALKTALLKCEGVKVKDDVDLLKKTIKEKKIKKLKSIKKWKAREKQVQKDKEMRQKKRTQNIQEKSKKKKLQKLKKAAKKGRLISGF